jgi:hypothetical protein
VGAVVCGTRNITRASHPHRPFGQHTREKESETLRPVAELDQAPFTAGHGRQQNSASIQHRDEGDPGPRLFQLPGDFETQ